MESGFNARAVDFAKLGRLLLARGQANGRTIVSASWVDALLRVDPGTRVPGMTPTVHYQRGWWVHAPDTAQPHAVAGWGHLGQFLYVYPDLDVMLVRFGTGMGDVESWPRLFHDLARRSAQRPRKN